MKKHTVMKVTPLMGNYFILELDAQGRTYSPCALFSLGLLYGPTRVYSTISPGSSRSLEFLIHARGSVSDALFKLQPGEVINCEFSGRMFLPEAGGVWIANGTGIAPFVSLLRHDPKQLPRQLVLGLPFYMQEILAPFQDIPASDLVLSISKERVDPSVFYGRLTDHLQDIKIDKNQKYFICGSGDMITQVSGDLIKRGVNWTSIETEIFG